MMNQEKNSSITLTNLFQMYSEQDNPPTLELLDADHKPVAALFLKSMRFQKLVISETNNTEKYFLYVDGVGIYFSYFRKSNL